MCVCVCVCACVRVCVRAYVRACMCASVSDDDDDDDDDNFIAIYMYITRHTCNGMRFSPELLHSMLPTIQYFHPYST